MKRLTISSRWRIWAQTEPVWAYTALTNMVTSIFGLGLHLWVLAGLWRTVGLYILIGCGLITEAILAYRRQWWWLTFWTYVILGVIAWEIMSYYFGSMK